MKYLLLILLLFSAPTLAEVRINTLNLSYHFDRESPFNKSHKGLGIEVETWDNLYLGLTHFENSFYQKSRMLTIIGEYQIGDSELYWGPMFAYSDGYSCKPISEEDPQGAVKCSGNDYQMLAGITTKWKAIRLHITPILMAVGLVFEIK